MRESAVAHVCGLQGTGMNMIHPYSKEMQLDKQVKVPKPIKKVSRKQVKELGKRRKMRKKFTTEVCQECGEPPDWRGLQMHHKEHLSQGGKTVKPNLVMLCGHCHAEYHKIKEVP